MPQAIRTRVTPPVTTRDTQAPAAHGAEDLTAHDADPGQTAHGHAHGGWHGMVAKLVVGGSILSALILPGVATQQKPVDASLLSARNAQVQIMTQRNAQAALKVEQGTTFRLVAPGPQHTVTADDALSFIVAAYRMQDGSKVSFADVRALNPAIFARDAAGSVLVPGDVVTLPLGAEKVREPKKLVTRAEVADTVASGGQVVTLPVVDTTPGKTIDKTIDKTVEPKPVVVDARTVDTKDPADAASDATANVVRPAPRPVVTPVVQPVVQPVVTPVVDARPAVPEHAAFKFPALQVGKQLPAEGVFKTKKFFKTWTIEFAGSAKVVASDAGKLVLHVKATGKNGIFEGKTRTVALEWQQQGAQPEVRFSGKQLGDTEDGEDGDVGAKLSLVSASATESVFKDPKDGKLVRLKIDGSQLTLTYQDNTIRFRLAP